MMMTPRLWMLALGLSASATAWAEDATSYARQLAELRSEVQELADTLSLEQEALRTDLRASEVRRAELEARIRQEELQLAELERELQAQREVLSSEDRAGSLLTPVLQRALEDLRVRVRAGLPYRTGERLAAVDSIADQVEGGTLDPRRALGRAWQLVEDELRLTRENIMDRQVIEVGGEEQLVDIARLGMVAVFYRTDDELVGRAVRQGDGWVWQPISDAGDVARVAELFDALSKQVRVGWFDLPWALPEVSR